MNRLWLAGILFLSILPLMGGSCDRTNIRGMGNIVVQQQDLAVGEEIDLILKIPEELEGKVYRAMWRIDPADAGTINYEENRIFGEKAVDYTKDRDATLITSREGPLTVDVMMIYYRQTSPQCIASKKLEIRK